MTTPESTESDPRSDSTSDHTSGPTSDAADRLAASPLRTTPTTNWQPGATSSS